MERVTLYGVCTEMCAVRSAWWQTNQTHRWGAKITCDFNIPKGHPNQPCDVLIYHEGQKPVLMRLSSTHLTLKSPWCVLALVGSTVSNFSTVFCIIVGSCMTARGLHSPTAYPKCNASMQHLEQHLALIKIVNCPKRYRDEIRNWINRMSDHAKTWAHSGECCELRASYRCQIDLDGGENANFQRYWPG